MPARLIYTRPPLQHRLWRAIRVAYLRWRISEARADMAYMQTDPSHRPEQLDAYRLQIGVWEVEILTLENT